MDPLASTQGERTKWQDINGKTRRAHGEGTPLSLPPSPAKRTVVHDGGPLNHLLMFLPVMAEENAEVGKQPRGAGHAGAAVPDAYQLTPAQIAPIAHIGPPRRRSGRGCWRGRRGGVAHARSAATQGKRHGEGDVVDASRRPRLKWEGSAGRAGKGSQMEVGECGERPAPSVDVGCAPVRIKMGQPRRAAASLRES